MLFVFLTTLVWFDLATNLWVSFICFFCFCWLFYFGLNSVWGLVFEFWLVVLFGDSEVWFRFCSLYQLVFVLFLSFGLVIVWFEMMFLVCHF
jgi:hypothetical protein